MCGGVALLCVLSVCAKLANFPHPPDAATAAAAAVASPGSHFRQQGALLVAPRAPLSLQPFLPIPLHAIYFETKRKSDLLATKLLLSLCALLCQWLSNHPIG